MTQILLWFKNGTTTKYKSGIKIVEVLDFPDLSWKSLRIGHNYSQYVP